MKRIYLSYSRISFFNVAFMAVRGPFSMYVDMIIDYTIFYYVVVALGGFKIIIENITSFPSTVSIVLDVKILIHVQWTLVTNI